MLIRYNERNTGINLKNKIILSNFYVSHTNVLQIKKIKNLLFKNLNYFFSEVFSFPAYKSVSYSAFELYNMLCYEDIVNKLFPLSCLV